MQVRIKDCALPFDIQSRQELNRDYAKLCSGMDIHTKIMLAMILERDYARYLHNVFRYIRRRSDNTLALTSIQHKIQNRLTGELLLCRICISGPPKLCPLSGLGVPAQWGIPPTGKHAGINASNMCRACMGQIDAAPDVITPTRIKVRRYSLGKCIHRLRKYTEKET